jgi:hypothetical protein
VAEIYYYLDMNEDGQITQVELDQAYTQVVDQGSGLSVDQVILDNFFLLPIAEMCYAQYMYEANGAKDWEPQ